MKYTGDDRFDTWCPAACPDRKREVLYMALRAREEESPPTDDPRDVLLAEVAAALGVVYRPGDARSVAVLRAVVHGRRVPPAPDALTRAARRVSSDPGATSYRVGGTNPRNVYLVVDGHDFHVLNTFDPSDGPYVAEALNWFLERGPHDQQQL